LVFEYDLVSARKPVPKLPTRSPMRAPTTANGSGPAWRPS